MAAPKHDPFSDLQKKSIDAAMHLTQLTLENAQRVAEVQVDTTKALFEDAIDSMRALADAKDTRTAMDIRNKLAQSSSERWLSCTRKIAELTASTQNEMGRMISQQITSSSSDVVEGINRMMQGMPLPGTETMSAIQSAIESARGAMEQMAKASQEAFSSFTNITSRAAGVATKTATAAIIEPFTPRVAAVAEGEPVVAHAVAGKKAVKHQ